MSNILTLLAFIHLSMLQHFINFILFLWYEALCNQGSVHRYHKIYHTVSQRKHTVSITKTHLLMLFVLRTIQNLCTFWVK
jgi:hypothetical protein